MKRDYKKLERTYDKKYGTRVDDLILISDIESIREQTNGDYFKSVVLALKAGIVIGYNQRKKEEKKSPRPMREH